MRVALKTLSVAAIAGIFATLPAAAAAAPARIAVATASGSIAVVDANGRRVATLTGHAGWQDREPAWSPDGKRIAFTRTTDGDRSFQVYVMRADGSHARRLTGGRYDWRPAWSPDGHWIAFQSTRGIEVVHPDGTGRRRVPTAASEVSHPSWAPGGRIAYALHPETPNSTVVTSRLDGSNRRAVVHGRDAQWSPDGRTIVFTPPDGGVATARADGSRPRSLGRGYKAEWSPTGRQIVFARLGDVSDTIWLMRRDGTHRRRIVSGASDPAWRPA